ncbi:hypothetical protein DNTS_013600 [Danionella cerebrum]|uniref:Neurotrophin-3 n=1 Tax=Danionella cerebrum TaxID=2873325 RepID=A0A553RJY0_9TELE|nr:hypothetical protein DNTS_013600 [Danionella translucida]
MSILLYVMFLAYLYGISASSMDKQRPTQDPINGLIIKLLQAEISQQKQDKAFTSSSFNTSASSADYKEKSHSGLRQPFRDISPAFLRQYKRYNSPRVLLSDRPPLKPPPLYLMDDFVSSQDSNRTRQKRYAEHKSYRGEFSVCESQSKWVEKTEAVDVTAKKVTVLKYYNTKFKSYSQYFYETTCNLNVSTNRNCQGIDEKRWNSQCKTTQAFVRAYTSSDGIESWRWIRINTACVCALSRKHKRT